MMVEKRIAGLVLLGWITCFFGWLIGMFGFPIEDKHPIVGHYFQIVGFGTFATILIIAPFVGVAYAIGLIRGK